MINQPPPPRSNGPSATVVITSEAEWRAFWAGIENDFASMDLGPTLNQELGFLEMVHNDYFFDAVDPGGTAWAPLAPSTIAAKGHSNILVDTNRLLNSLTGPGPDAIRRVEGQRGNYQLVFGTNVEYAVFHDTGTATMPARPAVGFSDETLDKMTDHVLDGAVEQLK